MTTTPPEPARLSLDIDIPIAVFDLNPIELIEQHPEDWAAVADPEEKGYLAHERFPAFVSRIIGRNLQATLGLEVAAKAVEFGWVDPHFKWSVEDAERLDCDLRRHAEVSDPRVVSLFDL